MRIDETTEAHKQRVDARVRAFLIALHGLAPEDPRDRYAATTGEMLAWLRLDGRYTEATLIWNAWRGALAPYAAASFERMLRDPRTPGRVARVR